MLCFGRSKAGLRYVLRRRRRVALPGGDTAAEFEQLRANSYRFTWPLDKLPPNVRILPDEGTDESMIRAIEKAKLVVLPFGIPHRAERKLKCIWPRC